MTQVVRNGQACLFFAGLRLFVSREPIRLFASPLTAAATLNVTAALGGSKNVPRQKMPGMSARFF